MENHHAINFCKSTISTGPFSIANCNKLPEGKSVILREMGRKYLRQRPAGSEIFDLGVG
jgi:hypothetical protein